MAGFIASLKVALSVVFRGVPIVPRAGVVDITRGEVVAGISAVSWPHPGRNTISSAAKNPVIDPRRSRLGFSSNCSDIMSNAFCLRLNCAEDRDALLRHPPSIVQSLPICIARSCFPSPRVLGPASCAEMIIGKRDDGVIPPPTSCSQFGSEPGWRYSHLYLYRHRTWRP